MGDKSKIEWTDATWNPVVGCSVISPGCTNCYAMKMAGRLEAMGQPIYQGHTIKTKAGFVWSGKVAASNWAQVIKPLSWKKPRRIFVNSMSDLFHSYLRDEVIDQVFAVMALCPQHTFQVLTKRAARMREYFTAPHSSGNVSAWQARVCAAIDDLVPERTDASRNARNRIVAGQLPNVWLGVSAEDQARADERIPHLLATPAAVRFLSAEPLLGPLDIRQWLDGHEDHGVDMARPVGQRVGACTAYTPPLDWVIVGGESGPGARPFDLAWARSLVDQCRSAAVACFVKQLGAFPVDSGDPARGSAAGTTWKWRDRKGGDWSEWPEGLRVRECPHAA